jgi:hypothetical protein
MTFDALPADWTAIPVMVQGERRGRLAVKGTECHLEIEKHPCITRATVREVLGPLLEQHGYLTTRARKSDTQTALFLGRMNFKPTWSDDSFDYFMCETLPFQKGT